MRQPSLAITIMDHPPHQIEVAPVAGHGECVAHAEAAERLAAKCYNVVEYAEHLEAARMWRHRAAVAGKPPPSSGNR